MRRGSGEENMGKMIKVRLDEDEWELVYSITPVILPEGKIPWGVKIIEVSEEFYKEYLKAEKLFNKVQNKLNDANSDTLL